MTAPACRVCAAPTPGSAVLCQPCLDQVDRALGDATAAAAELVTTWARLDRVGQAHTPSHPDHTSLPWRERARDAADTLRAALVAEVRDLHDGAEPWPDDTVPAMAGWLLVRLDRIRLHDAAETTHAAVTRAVADAWRAVDHAPDLTYAGPCGHDDCPEHLYATLGAPTIECPACHATHDVPARHQWLLDAVRDTLATAVEISRALTSLDQPVTGERIRQWATRGRLLAHGVDRHGHPTYRVGDVQDLLADELRRRRERGATRRDTPSERTA